MDEPKRGRPTKFNETLSVKILELVEAGKTDAQIAQIIGISRKTFVNWKSAQPDFLLALKVSKQAADELVEASLFHRAVGYKHKATKIMATQWGGVIKEDYIEQYPPDTTAAIFWLKNRQPDKWRDKTEVEHSGKIEDVSDSDLDAKIEEKIKKLSGG